MQMRERKELELELELEPELEPELERSVPVPVPDHRVPILMRVPVSRLSSRRVAAGGKQEHRMTLGLPVYSLLTLIKVGLHHTNHLNYCPGCDKNRYYVAHIHYFGFLPNRLPDLRAYIRLAGIQLFARFKPMHHLASCLPF